LRFDCRQRKSGLEDVSLCFLFVCVFLSQRERERVVVE
jgi:hypothetical protein